MADIVLDASAVLALLHREAGAERVKAALPAAMFGSVNLAEVVTKLVERRMPPESPGCCWTSIWTSMLLTSRWLSRAACCERAQGIEGCPWATGHAWRWRRLGARVLTADRAWQGLDLGVPVEMLR
jgi:hypothetical protein